MTYSISLSGHGVPREDVTEAFENVVRALRAASTDGNKPAGQLYSNDGVGGAGDLRINASDVKDIDPQAIVDEEEDEDVHSTEAPSSALGLLTEDTDDEPERPEG